MKSTAEKILQIQLVENQQGETLAGTIYDDSGNAAKLSTYYGKFEFIMAVDSAGTPLCSIAVRLADGFRVEWEEVKDSGLLAKIVEVSDKGNYGMPFEFSGQTVKVEHYFADMLMALDENRKLLICVAITANGHVINFWCYPNYRRSQSMDIFTDIAYGTALEREWISRGLENIYSWVAASNLASNSYVKRIGSQLIGQLAENGTTYNVYRYSRQSRIDRARKIAAENGIIWN